MKITELLQISPIPCDLKVGDKIIYTNGHRVEFEMFVRGFSEPMKLGNKNNCFINLAQEKDGDGSGSAFWYPHAREEIKKINS